MPGAFEETGRVAYLTMEIALRNEGHMGGRVPAILLDTDLEENHTDDRAITHCLYGGD